MNTATFRTVLTTLCLLVALAAGAQGEPPGTRTQQMLSLAFTAYLDETFIHSDTTLDQEFTPCFETALEVLPKLEGSWQLAWGPYVSKFTNVIFTDNLMYAAEETGAPVPRLAVVIRGTNYISLSDWLVEDFEIYRMVEWTSARAGDCDQTIVPKAGDGPRPPMIAEGTCKGLRALLELPPQDKVEVPPILSFVRKWLHENPGSSREIYVTGHSLGGTLTPVMALWLREHLDDPTIIVQTYSFAGLTPGNTSFAAEVEAKLTLPNIHRINNPLDFAPLEWKKDFKQKASTLYQSTPLKLEPNEVEKLLFNHEAKQLEYHDYAHAAPHYPPLTRTTMPVKERTVLKQGFWQHHYGYLYGLDMLNQDDGVCKPCAASMAKNFCNEAGPGSDD